MDFLEVKHDFGLWGSFKDFKPQNYLEEDPFFPFDFDPVTGLYRGWVVVGFQNSYNQNSYVGFLENPEDLKGDKVLFVSNTPIILYPTFNNRVFEIWFSPLKAIQVPSEPVFDYSGFRFPEKPLVNFDDNCDVIPSQYELAKRVGANAIYERVNTDKVSLAIFHPANHVKAVYWRDFVPDLTHQRLFHGL